MMDRFCFFSSFFETFLKTFFICDIFYSFSGVGNIDEQAKHVSKLVRILKTTFPALLRVNPFCLITVLFVILLNFESLAALT